LESALSSFRVAAASLSVISTGIDSSSPGEVPMNTRTLRGTSNDRLILSIVDKGGSRPFLSSKDMYEVDNPALAASAGIDNFFCCLQNLIACPTFIVDFEYEKSHQCLAGIFRQQYQFSDCQSTKRDGWFARFEARRDSEVGNCSVWKSLIFNNRAHGMSVANSPESTTKHF